MSTRANIIIKDKHETFYFYRHSDGYPDCTGEDLKEFVKLYEPETGHLRGNASQSAGWLILRGHEEYSDYETIKGFNDWKVGAYEPTTDIHGDIRYLYIIDLSKGELAIQSANNWDGDLKTETIETVKFKTKDY